MNDPTAFSCFSGIGGFDLAAELLGFRVVGHSEIDPFACHVYHSHFPESECFGGIKNVTATSVFERTGVHKIDVLFGGWPCQGNSCAGKRKGMQDERSGLWGELIRVVSELRPRYCLFENVAGVLTVNAGRDFGQCMSDLAALRYACQWQVISASDVGAPHRRERVWILCWDELADSAQGGRGELREPSWRRGQSDGGGEVLADAEQQRGCGGDCKRQHANDVEPSSARTLLWPALSGHWPSRPGEQQHGWEPPRVVGNAATTRCTRTENTRTSGSNEGEGPRGEKPERAGGYVGNANQRQCKQHGGGKPNERELQGSDCRCGETDGKRQTQSSLGLCADGLPAAMGGVGEEVFWRTPSAEEAGAKVETLYTKDGQPARPGERAYRLQPDGRLVLQSVTINQQVEMVGGYRAGGDWPEVHNRVSQLKAAGNAIVPWAAVPCLLAILKSYERNEV